MQKSQAKTSYGADGILYAANTDEDAAKVTEAIPECAMSVIDSGHDIHYEKPSEFVDAIMLSARGNVTLSASNRYGRELAFVEGCLGAGGEK